MLQSADNVEVSRRAGSRRSNGMIRLSRRRLAILVASLGTAVGTAGLVLDRTAISSPALHASWQAVSVTKKIKVVVPTPAPKSTPPPVESKYVAPNLKVNAPAGTAAVTGSEQGVPSSKDAASAAVRHGELARSATLSLLVTDVGRALTAVRTLAAAEAGDVTALSDQRPDSERDGHSVDITIAVPSDRFDIALDRLAALGGVRARTVAAENLGDQLVDDAARLRNLRRTEADMLRIMDRSGKIGEVLDVENQLSSVRESIERLDAESKALQRRVAYATIEVSLSGEAIAATAEPSLQTQLDAAWQTAVRRLSEFTLGVAAGTFVLVAFAPYWLGAALIVGGVLIAATRRFARHYQN